MLFSGMIRRIQGGEELTLSGFAEELSPEQMSRLAEIVNRDLPMSEEILSDYIHILKDAPLRNLSRHVAEMSGDELLDAVERLRQKKK